MALFLYTKIFKLLKPSVNQFVDSEKDAISIVEGKDDVTGAEDLSLAIKNETDMIEVKNPVR